MRIYLVYCHDTLKGAVKAKVGSTSSEIIEFFLKFNGIKKEIYDTYWLSEMTVAIME